MQLYILCATNKSECGCVCFLKAFAAVKDRWNYVDTFGLIKRKSGVDEESGDLSESFVCHKPRHDLYYFI